MNEVKVLLSQEVAICDEISAQISNVPPMPDLCDIRYIFHLLLDTVQIVLFQSKNHIISYNYISI